MGTEICGCNNPLSTSNETNIVIDNMNYYIYIILQYRINRNRNIIKGTEIIQTQIRNEKFIKNWSLSNFNDLSLIQRITIVHNVNKIIKAFRNYISKKDVRKIIINFCSLIILIPKKL